MTSETKLSFAQNGEDMLLWRCFQKDHGFYVDVGASSPVHDSVTQFFYERGWTGINFEPIPERVNELRRLRPRDVTVQAAVSDTVELMRLHRTTGIGGLSTASMPEEFAELYQAHSWPMLVETVTLSQQLEALGVTEIDFLKIDAEGAESAVIAGIDLSRWRPSVIVVEATKPMSPDPAYDGWEPQLLQSGYRFVWFDGLNRYYVAGEKGDELQVHFERPLNVFDRFVPIAHFGHPLLNPRHPNHQFGCHLAHLLLKAVGVESDDYLVQVICLDQPPMLLENAVERSTVQVFYGAVFGRSPSEEEINAILSWPVQTGRDLVRALIVSDDFKKLRARVSV